MYQLKQDVIYGEHISFNPKENEGKELGLLKVFTYEMNF